MTVDLGGALVTPAFVDAHVHATDTGLALAGLDLAGDPVGGASCSTRSRRYAATPAGRRGRAWATAGTSRRGRSRCRRRAAELDRAAGGRRVYLTQASVHSALVSSALLAAAPARRRAGLRRRRAGCGEEAHHAVRAVALGSLTGRAAHGGAADRAAAGGVAGHRARCTSAAARARPSEDDFTGLLALSGRAACPRCTGYWGELMAAAKAGSWARSVRAATCTPTARSVRGPRSCASRTWTVGGVRLRVRDRGAGRASTCWTAPRHGMQGGFHAIGDAAIATVLDGLRGGGEGARGGPVAGRAGTGSSTRSSIDKAMIARVRRVRDRGEHAAGVRPAVGRPGARCTRSGWAWPGRWSRTRWVRCTGSG